MHRAIRTQADDLGDEYSELTSVDFTDSRDMARQEFKADADINLLLARYGVGTPQRLPVFGEVDFTLDLQKAFEAIGEAKLMHARLPENLRAKYRDWASLLNALDSGALQLDLTPVGEKPETVPDGTVEAG